MPNKMKEFRGMSDEQLSLALKDLEKHLFQLRFQSATDRLETPSEIRKAKRDIARLKTLTPQQTRVLGMIGEGLLNKQIAYELGVSEATIKAHVSAILLKLNVDSRTQAVIQLGKIGAAQAAA